MNKGRSMPWALALLLAFLPPGSQASLGEGMKSITRPIGSSLVITCDLGIEKRYIHWYRVQDGKAPERLLYYDFLKSEVADGLRLEKYNAYKHTEKSCNFVLRNVEESDSDKSFDADMSPKPTIFLPSVAEMNLHKAGTYLCLLGEFFPDVINVYWKDKDNKILESQEGDTMKTNDTYMKVSWLTVTGESMDKEHRCIVKHENNKNGVNQEIFFPPVKKVSTSTDPEACLKDENSVLQLQITSTSAYYTYLLLLLKSTIYLAIINFVMFRRTAVCHDGKSS